jgi:butyrate kinase
LAKYRILVINPGSTSTKIGVYDDEDELFSENLAHSVDQLAPYPRIVDQEGFRREVIYETLNARGIRLETLSGVVGRGGLLRPIPGGTYRVTERMLNDLRIGVQGEHASNLGGILADRIAQPLGIPAFIVDPVVVDELEPIARVSGMPDLRRRSIFHALNHKSVARRATRELGKRYEEVNLVVAHLGGGISVGVHKQSRVVDVNNALNGDGPFAPERSGGLPAWDLVELALSGRYTKEELRRRITGKGGVVAYLGTNDMRELKRRVLTGDEEAKLIYEAMAYQVAKEIGACAAILSGKVDAIVISGGLAYDERFVNLIKSRVGFIARVLVYPGGDEMCALAEGTLRVLRGEEEAKEY